MICGRSLRVGRWTSMGEAACGIHKQLDVFATPRAEDTRAKIFSTYSVMRSDRRPECAGGHDDNATCVGVLPS